MTTSGVKKGDVVRRGMHGNFEFEVTYVAGVGDGGVGEGVYDWQVRVVKKTGAQRTPVALMWMTGPGSDVADRYVKYLVDTGAF